MLRTPLIMNMPNSRMNMNHPASMTPDQHKFSVNTILGTFSCGKAIVSLAVLLTDSGSHYRVKIWLLLALISDLISTLVFALKTKKLLYRQIEAQESNQPSDFDHIEDLEGQTGRQDPTSTSSSNGNSDRIRSTLSYIKRFNTYFYLTLLVWGHELYYVSCKEDCFGVGGAAGNLVFLYLYCGYFYILWLILKRIFANRLGDLAQMTQNVAKVSVWSPHLPAKDYGSDFKGSNECHICLLNYNEGDQLAELPCDTKHHFHKACVEKWLKLNDACPLCRKNVSGRSQDTTKSDIELYLISASNPLGI